MTSECALGGSCAESSLLGHVGHHDSVTVCCEQTAQMLGQLDLSGENEVSPGSDLGSSPASHRTQTSQGCETIDSEMVVSVERLDSVDTDTSNISRDSTSVADDYTDYLGVDIEEFIISTLNKNQRDRVFLLQLETDLQSFLQDESRTTYRTNRMSSYHRMIVHRVAAFYGFEHNVDNSGVALMLVKTRKTRIPDMKFSEHCAAKHWLNISDVQESPERVNDYTYRSNDAPKHSTGRDLRTDSRNPRTSVVYAQSSNPRWTGDVSRIHRPAEEQLPAVERVVSQDVRANCLPFPYVPGQGIYVLVSSPEQIPTGSCIINPHTGQPCMNADGSPFTFLTPYQQSIMSMGTKPRVSTEMSQTRGVYSAPCVNAQPRVGGHMGMSVTRSQGFNGLSVESRGNEQQGGLVGNQCSRFQSQIPQDQNQLPQYNQTHVPYANQSVNYNSVLSNRVLGPGNTNSVVFPFAATMNPTICRGPVPAWTGYTQEGVSKDCTNTATVSSSNNTPGLVNNTITNGHGTNGNMHGQVLVAYDQNNSGTQYYQSAYPNMNVQNNQMHLLKTSAQGQPVQHSSQGIAQSYLPAVPSLVKVPAYYAVDPNHLASQQLAQVPYQQQRLIGASTLGNVPYVIHPGPYSLVNPATAIQVGNSLPSGAAVRFAGGHNSVHAVSGFYPISQGSSNSQSVLVNGHAPVASQRTTSCSSSNSSTRHSIIGVVRNVPDAGGYTSSSNIKTIEDSPVDIENEPSHFVLPENGEKE